MVVTRHEGGQCGKGSYHEPPCDPPSTFDVTRKPDTRIADLAADLRTAREALEQHAKPLGEWDMLWIAPNGTMPGGHVADAHWARAHIDALLAALDSISKEEHHGH